MYINVNYYILSVWFECTNLIVKNTRMVSIQWRVGVAVGGMELMLVVCNTMAWAGVELRYVCGSEREFGNKQKMKSTF